MSDELESKLASLDFDFQVKSVDQKKRIIEGYASTPHLDEGDDIVEAGAAKFTEVKSVIPFIGHKHNELPIGIPLEIKYDDQGRLFTSTRIHKTHAGDDLLAVAAERAAEGMPLGISIGYPPSSIVAKYERKSGRLVRRIQSLDLAEYSFTPIPMNDHARVTAVKSREKLARKAVAEMSAEERRAEIDEAIRARILAPAIPPSYAYVVATFDAYVIVSDGDDYFRIEYTMGTDGEVTLGAQSEVEQTWTAKGAATADAEVVADELAGGDSAKSRKLTGKAGRVLSDKNVTHLQDIHDRAHEMAANAGHELHPNANDDDSTQGKSADLALMAGLLDFEHIEASARQTARKVN